MIFEVSEGSSHFWNPRNLGRPQAGDSRDPGVGLGSSHNPGPKPYTLNPFESQRLQNLLIQEYTWNHIRGPIIF